MVKKLKTWVSVLLIASVFATLAGVFYFIKGYYCSPANTPLNAIGDYVGGVAGALWGLAGVLFVAIAFFYQQIQIEYQKVEISINREDSRKQYFENTFFNLLNLHHRIISNIDVSGGSTPITGTDCFKTFASDFRSIYNQQEPIDINAKTIEASKVFFKQKSSDLGHYMANLEAIIRFVKDSFYYNEADYIDNLNELKDEYYRMIVAQISTYELLICSYYCYIDKDFKELFKLLNIKEKLDPEDFIEKNQYTIL